MHLGQQSRRVQLSFLVEQVCQGPLLSRAQRWCLVPLLFLAAQEHLEHRWGWGS